MVCKHASQSAITGANALQAREVTEDEIGMQLFYEPPTLETASSTASVEYD